MQERKNVLDSAEWYVYSHYDLLKYMKRSRVAVIGSGAWACAAARMVAQNTASATPGDEFVDEVKMWVYEEDVNVLVLFFSPVLGRVVLFLVHFGVGMSRILWKNAHIDMCNT